MLTYPNINPIAFQIGPLAVHWYGLMYLLGLLAGWALLTYRVHKRHEFTSEQLSDIVFYTALGVIIGGRVGYVLFYNLSAFLENPWFLFQIWKGGMSFHGGALGVIFSLWFYAHKIGKSLGEITDFVVPVIPVGLAAGRIGNFINGELWGRVTDVPWAMIFPNAGDFPRHPSQLYEFFLEGVVLFIILWLYSARPRPRYAVSALFLICYALFRFSVEFFREPDQQIGFVAFNWLTKGQLLSIPMFAVGIVIFLWSYRQRSTPCNNT